MHLRSRTLFVLALAVLPLAACGSGGEARADRSALREPDRRAPEYPEARRGDTVDTYHGVEVADPYRWLEDPDAPESRAWIEAQNRLVADYLDEVPGREVVRDRLEVLWDYPRHGVPGKSGGKYFYTKNDGLQNQSVLYVRDSMDAEPRVLLDPNTLSSDGTVALNGWWTSDDGRYLAYGVAEAGSDWTTFKVRDVASGRDLNDTLRWVKFSNAAWTKDGAGFFYSRYAAPQPGEELSGVNYDQKLYFHRIGTDQAADELVYERPDHKEWGFFGNVSEDGQWLVITCRQGTDPRRRIFFKDLTQPGSEVQELLGEGDAAYSFVGNDGPVLWFRTNKDAPRNRLVAISTVRPQEEFWREIVPERVETLQSVDVVGNHLICSYLVDAHTRVDVLDLKGNPIRTVDLPGIGTAGGFFGKRDDPETFYSFRSYTNPGTVFRYNVLTGRSRIFHEPDVDFDPESFVTRQVFFASKDGTRVPMFITHRRGLRKNGANPTLLYGYGGFNVSLTPSFSPARIAWMELGGVFAVANLRGGGEYGEAWHQAGTKLKKQNVFDDFIAAAEYLIAEDYTSPDRLAIQGGSNGGLLVGACVNQRPDLYGAAIPAVGVMDMLRFHRFTIGWAWTSDYGCADEDPDEFRALLAYSPYHNARRGTCYPPVLVTTSDHDDRVVPAHSFKYAAAMQHAQSCANPILIRIETRAGHGAGKPTSKRIEQAADEMAFLIRELGVAADLEITKGPAGVAPEDR